MLEQSSAMLNAVDWMNKAATNQPHIAPPVPEYPNEYPMVEATEGSKPSTENETPKDSHMEKSL